MTERSIVEFGFSYECDGKQYSFVVIDESEAMAVKRVAAMATAKFCGQLRAVEDQQTTT